VLELLTARWRLRVCDPAFASTIVVWSSSLILYVLVPHLRVRASSRVKRLLTLFLLFSDIFAAALSPIYSSWLPPSSPRTARRKPVCVSRLPTYARSIFINHPYLACVHVLPVHGVQVWVTCVDAVLSSTRWRRPAASPWNEHAEPSRQHMRNLPRPRHLSVPAACMNALRLRAHTPSQRRWRRCMLDLAIFGAFLASGISITPSNFSHSCALLDLPNLSFSAPLSTCAALPPPATWSFRSAQGGQRSPNRIWTRFWNAYLTSRRGFGWTRCCGRLRRSRALLKRAFEAGSSSSAARSGDDGMVSAGIRERSSFLSLPPRLLMPATDFTPESTGTLTTT
jgi:hypothetical protein